MDDDDDYSSEDIEDIEEKALADLRSGKLIVKISDGTLRCPYSPSKKKQAYPYKDLLQHAEGVARGKRGPEAAGKHRALQTYLVEDLASMVTPPVERVHKLGLSAPRRKDADDLLVYPWSGLIYNIDNKARSSTGQSAGPGVAEINRHFSMFYPDKAHVFWGPKGHMGMGVITFRRSSEGLKDALAFEKWFIDNGLSRRDWERRRQGNGLGSELYGWLARKEDYEGRRDTKDDIFVAKHLQDTGDLKDVGRVGDEMNKIHDQRFKSLAETVSVKNEEVRDLLTKSEVARRNAEYVKQQLEEKHKEELEEVKIKAKQSTEEHAKAMHKHNQKLQSSMDALKKRCKDLEDKEKHMKNQADRSRLEQEKYQNRRQLDMVNQQTEMQKKHQTEQVKLIEKHQDQSKKLELYIQDMKLRLATKQQKELELQRLEEMIDTDKFKEIAESFIVPDEEHKNNTEELEDKLKSMEKQKAKIEKELEDVKDENDTYTDRINALTKAERTANDELEEARKFAVMALSKRGSATIKVKRMGEMEDAPWEAACKQRYKDHMDGWEVVLKEKYSKWEALLSNHEFSPFKTVQIGEKDEWERQVDEKDEQLQALQSELGDEVCQVVVTALKELEDYNASGRYPIPVVWNFEQKRRATLKEVLEVLKDVIEMLEPKKKRKRNVLNNRT